MKKCPFCAGEIQEEAVKCRHCGEWLTGKPIQHHLIGFRDYVQPFYDKAVALFKNNYNNLSGNIEAYKNKKPESLYAGYRERFGAFIIDAIILFIFCVTLAKVTNNAIYFFILFWLYFSLSESSIFHATIGKIMLNIFVADNSLHKISFLKASLRFVFKFLPLLLFIILKESLSGKLGAIEWGIFYVLFFTYLYPIFDLTQKRRFLHDRIAGTFVINKIAESKQDETISETGTTVFAIDTKRIDSSSNITEESKPFETESPPSKGSKTRIPLSYVIGGLGIGILLTIIIIWPLFSSELNNSSNNPKLTEEPINNYDRFVLGLPTLDPGEQERRRKVAVAQGRTELPLGSPEANKLARKLYDERKSVTQVSKPEPAPPPRKKTTWPASAKVAWISRCVSSLVSQGVPEQHARTYATCIANGLEKEFGMEEYDHMMKARPNPKGSEYDRRLNKVFESCGNLPRP